MLDPYELASDALESISWEIDYEDSMGVKILNRVKSYIWLSRSSTEDESLAVLVMETLKAFTAQLPSTCLFDPLRLTDVAGILNMAYQHTTEYGPAKGSSVRNLMMLDRVRSRLKTASICAKNPYIRAAAMLESSATVSVDTDFHVDGAPRSLPQISRVRNYLYVAAKQRA